ncbi:MAG: hybrid sensor histidine kinase/response regulator, partial [Butyrivibrio sp.]|nr:hybrid sensor histidine kinase/response regulator [Butyrivibrio sp.]
MLGLEKYKKSSVIIGAITGTAIMILLALFCIYAAMHGENMHISPGGTVIITFFILPYLLLGGLYGYLFSLMIFLIAFIVSLVNNTDDAYKMAIYLVVTICFSLFGQYFWFETKKKTALCAFITLVLTSAMELLCLTLIEISEYGLEQIMNYRYYFVRDALVIFVTAFLYHFYLVLTPDFCKYPFPVAVDYTGYYQKDKELKRSLRKTKVSYKITTIIIAVELLLGIFVAIFMVVLFPDIKDMFAAPFHRGALTGANAEEMAQQMTERIEEMKYTLSATAVTYDIKMMLLMLCIGVPMASIANFYTKT